jgi:hypothetical protein
MHDTRKGRNPLRNPTSHILLASVRQKPHVLLWYCGSLRQRVRHALAATSMEHRTTQVQHSLSYTSLQLPKILLSYRGVPVARARGGGSGRELEGRRVSSFEIEVKLN